MRIMLLEDRPESLLSDLADVWEQSVRATHTFLTGDDIRFFSPLVRQALQEIPVLYVAKSIQGKVSGFLGIGGQVIEMLFLHPLCTGAGLGRRLVTLALEKHHVRFVDVNEQNIQAAGFYRHLGFLPIGRSPLDPSGKPFPIVHLEKQDFIRQEA